MDRRALPFASLAAAFRGLELDEGRAEGRPYRGGVVGQAPEQWRHCGHRPLPLLCAIRRVRCWLHDAAAIVIVVCRTPSLPVALLSDGGVAGG